MVTTTHKPRFLKGIPSRALLMLGLLALALGGLMCGFRSLDHSRSTFEPVVVTLVNGSTCTVVSQTDPDLVMSAPCPSGTDVGYTAVFEVGGLSHRPLDTGLDAALSLLWRVVALAGAVCLVTVWGRRGVRKRHERAAAKPTSMPATLGDDVQPPVARDRWAPVAPLPANTPSEIHLTLERVLFLSVGAMLAVGAAVVLDSFVRPAGLPLGLVLALDVVVAGVVLLLALAMSQRSVRWSVDGIAVRGYFTTGRYAWSDIDHATAEASETNSKNGHFWALTPALVLTSGERVELGALTQSARNGVPSTNSGAARQALRRYDILDAWLSSASVPVDAAYEAMRPWTLGEIAIEQAVGLSDSPPSTLFRAPVITTDSPSPARPAPDSVPPLQGGDQPLVGFRRVLQPSRGPKASRGVRALLILGIVLLALPGMLVVLGAPLLTYQLATGDHVDALVLSRSGDECVIANTADESAVWTTRCLSSDWAKGQTVSVIIGSDSKPMTWGNTMLGLVTLAILCIPGLVLVTIGLLRQRERRRSQSPGGAAEPTLTYVG